MNRHVSHHLARASAIGPSGSRFRQTELAPVIDDVVRTLKQIYVEKELNVEVEVPEDLQFQGERQDLIEIVGNIADNAFKWAAKRVRIGAEPREEGFLLSVDDDGPGLPATFQIDGFERGRRLDETVPGTGFGLAIVRDIVQLYGGDIALRRSRLGGMAVMLNLPAARALADFR
jgi:signal transduction histidine kinase